MLLARWIDPPLTLTMLERVWEQGRARGRWTWVDHRPVALERVGPTLPRAVVSSEDARFWLHHGFDLDGICAAIRKNRRAGEPVAGGSTISQQVARNVFLWQERSWLRKGLEAWYTLWLELLVPKERILELYLGVAETGPLRFGVESGARYHFGASAAALDAAQAGRLAAILPSPLRWSPDGATARERAAWIQRNRVPFPGDPGFAALAAEATREPWPPRSCRALLREVRP